ncbi:MAG: carboxypeptidase-like regulatory domain-containing protein [Acidimicrobiales bacterium]
MRQLRMVRTALACSALIAVTSSGLPATSVAAPARPLAAVVNKTSPLGTGALLEDSQDTATGCAAPPPAPGETCTTLSPQLISRHWGGPTTCYGILVLQVALQDDIVEYDAAWTPPGSTSSWAFSASGGPDGSGSGPYAEEYWSTKQVGYGGDNYPVPKGFGAWFVAAGGGNGPCNDAQGSAKAWGWTAHPTVSGKITVEGSGGTPAARVTVQASCPGGGTTTTDANGDYDFHLDPGPCTIAPQLQSGETSVPKQQVVELTQFDITNVDFQVPCGAVVPAGDTEAGRFPGGEALNKPSADDAPGDLACPLNVSLVQQEPLRSGLATNDELPAGGPMNFTVGTASEPYTEPNEAGQRCVSGCVNLLVTVTSAFTNKPVPGATVEASLSRFILTTPDDTGSEGIPYSDYGSQFLCIQSDKPVPECDTDSISDPTDTKGQVHLIYWAPGVPPGPAGSNWSATLKVYAYKCQMSGCPVHTGFGQAKPTTLTVVPYLIYQHTGELPAKEVQLLVDMVQEPNQIVADLASDHYAHHLIEEALTTLKLFDEHATSIAAGAGLVVSTTVHAVEAYTKIVKENGLIATLLVAENLSTLGLGAKPYATTVPEEASATFTHSILNNLGIVPTPFNPETLEPGGVLWSDAEALKNQIKTLPRTLATRTVTTGPEKITLEVYEVSHCDKSFPVCGPGYKDLPTAPESTTVEDHHGIQAELCFYFTGWDGLPGLDWSDHFCSPYDPLYWEPTQPDLSKGLPEPAPGPAVAVSPGTVTNSDFAQSRSCQPTRFSERFERRVDVCTRY